MRALICGDRKWTDAKLIYRAMKRLTVEDQVIEGEAQGADTIARVIADLRDIPVEQYPADWCDFGADKNGSGAGCSKQHTHHGFKAGYARNAAMLEAKPDEVWGFHDSIASSKGTKMMLKMACAAGVTTRLFSHQLDAGGVVLDAEWRG